MINRPLVYPRLDSRYRFRLLQGEISPAVLKFMSAGAMPQILGLIERLYVGQAINVTLNWHLLWKSVIVRASKPNCRPSLTTN
ncbi:MAG: hypothetical protein ACJA2E_000028 [Arenicella sp.]|jgi:hypothetical protein